MPSAIAPHNITNPDAPKRGTVLILGADGFIGRHLAFGLRAAGWTVIASARRTRRLSQMGFETLKADLALDDCAKPGFWRDRVQGVTHIVNSAGVLNASNRIAEAVHITAPKALYEALPKRTTGVLISAVGIDTATSGFATTRLAGEKVALESGLTVLRAGLVLGETSHGGSSLARALSALPWVTPVVGDGQQPFNPIHAADLTRIVDHALVNNLPDGVHEIGGPETITQSEMMRGLRRWLGLRDVPTFKLPLPMSRVLGRMGDAMQLGPISASAVTQLNAGVLAKNSSDLMDLPVSPRGFSDFITARPAGTQDLWHARLYLFRPLLRITLALMWLVSGMVGLFLPASEFLPLIDSPKINDTILTILARIGGMIDVLIAGALLRGWRPKLMTAFQIATVTGYTVVFTFLAPSFWLLPLGGLIKNIPILALIGLSAILEDER